MKREIVIAIAASVLAVGTTACNTVEGLGQDVQSVAEEGDEEL